MLFRVLKFVFANAMSTEFSPTLFIQALEKSKSAATESGDGSVSGLPRRPTLSHGGYTSGERWVNNHWVMPFFLLFYACLLLFCGCQFS